MTNPATPLACRPDAMTAKERQRYSTVRRELSGSILDTKELPDGYAMSHPADAATISLIAEFITLERLCCPFFRFALELTGAEDTVWLKLTGDKAAKRVLDAEFQTALE